MSFVYSRYQFWSFSCWTKWWHRYKLAILAEIVPFKFTNALDIDTSTGMVYFTDSNILFQRRYIFFCF
ncbi:hypothetical protein Godav_024030 [Gossypium davidsonii]|uniref:Strictosidine synthase conserved region domain-containing protein n=1 Tax=Gossypium davidsonii TaxID=34287 RepID=A0A7J8STP8_GOSDV|nr:hypothetical protein [Gossypium davidsonii]